MNTGTANQDCDRCTVINDGDNDNVADPGFLNYQAFAPKNKPTYDGPLNKSSNILLVYRLDEMRHMENVNFCLAFVCLAVCGMNAALVIVNYVNSHNEDDPPVVERT